ncbi:plasmid pRiA4b ORF-3 family protein [Subtercola vilae]|uniref:Plasmid pRiA4b ORF-3 family protein n=2 Tax=Subtercola vilae TaxID=2056433 RepID=A0A4T2BEI8_9MICO|nr:plasmid pRiA4b ORF-3 family protein [Subtercola vilae]
MGAVVRRIGPALLRVRIHLVGSEPEIWRLFEIDADLRLPQLHDALQIVMGWENSHLHEFLDFDPDLDGNITPMLPRRWASPFLREDDDEGAYLAEEDFALRDVLTDQAPLFYLYDLGDNWLHRLDLIETLPKNPGDPTITVIRGERRCPLEDSGGIDGYDHILHVLDHPADDEHDNLTEWVSSMHHNPRKPFNPATYDTPAVNQVLRRVFPATNIRTERA